METNTLSIVVPAAGCGVRTGLKSNKILAPLQGHPLLWWTLRRLTSVQPAGLSLCEMIIAARREEWPLVEAAIPWQNAAMTVCVEGGQSRQESVFNLARAARGEWILVHDAARPLVSARLVERVCQAAVETGAAIAALPASDTIKRSRAGHHTVAETIERTTVWLAQTPQVFRRRVLLQAFEQADVDGFQGTDCASLVERLRDDNGEALQPVALVAGEVENFKVTFEDDLQRAELLLATMC